MIIMILWFNIQDHKPKRVYCCSCLVCIVVVVLCVLLLVFLCVLLQLSCVYCCSCLVCIVVVVLCVLLQLSCVYCCSCLCVLLPSYVYFLYYVCIALFNSDAGLLARSQYSEGPATGHLVTGFLLWFPCVYKQTLRRFPTFQVATTCFSCSRPDLNLLVTNFMFCIHVK